MIHVRTEEEIARIRQCGRINAAVHEHIRNHLQSGISTAELDAMAEKVMQNAGARSSIYEPEGFPAHICISINQEVGHGIPGNRVLYPGDLVKVDVSVEYEGYHTDCAYTHFIGTESDEATHLVTATQEALWSGIASAQAGRRCSDISFAIHQVIEHNGLAAVRHAFGHGIGTDLHESPGIPNFGPKNRGPKLRSGMVIAIEPVTTAGGHLTHRSSDGWTDVTIDGSLSAHFEHTVLITDGEPEVLTLNIQENRKIRESGEGVAAIAYRDMAENEKCVLFQLAAEAMDPILIEAWGRRAHLEEIFIPAAKTVVLEDVSKKTAGFFVFSEKDDEIHLNTIVIDAPFQRQGLGKQVMRWLENLAKMRYLHRISLCVQRNNHRAIQFYRKFGFEVCGTPYANTLYMRKQLSQ